MNPTERKSSCLMTNLSKKLSTKRIFTQKINIEPGQLGYVLGGKVPREVNQLEEKYQVEISLPDKGGSQIIMEGPVGMVFAARSDIEESLPCTTSFFIEKDIISLVIGRKRGTIRALQKEFNAKIDIKQTKSS